jgi:trans-aconitate methyltransferase
VDERSRAHWERIYREKPPTSLPWYQREATVSLDLIKFSRVALDAPLVDVGAGTSTLVDGLLARGHTEVFLLDIADAAFAPTRRRLGPRANDVQYISADIATWRPVHTFGLWHDRALFHFMTEPAARDAYRATLRAALAPRGKVIVGVLGPGGPAQCGGLPVQRYSVEALAQELRPVARLIDSRTEVHRTPAGVAEPYVYALFERA